MSLVYFLLCTIKSLPLVLWDTAFFWINWYFSFTWQPCCSDSFGSASPLQLLTTHLPELALWPHSNQRGAEISVLPRDQREISQTVLMTVMEGNGSCFLFCYLETYFWKYQSLEFFVTIGSTLWPRLVKRWDFYAVLPWVWFLNPLTTREEVSFSGFSEFLFMILE